MSTELNEDKIKEILVAFYARVRADPSLSVPFSVVEDWDEHMERLSDFWSSLMLTTGRYKGNPLSMHAIHSDLIRPEMFQRWLELWKLTTNELLEPQTAEQMQAKATRIASRFVQSLFGEVSPVAVVVKPDNPRPYKVSRYFDEHTVPLGLLHSHSLKPGTWGVVRVEEGCVHYFEDSVKTILSPEIAQVIQPNVPHHLELSGPVKFRIEFYDALPTLTANK
ncbi:DUF1971 domain-containing protein [Rhizobium sp. Root1204]|uniref:DUF1971 domain-containing protein n=1 Tax=Rhizobium sp. Root1204 TaxID=1736428 RepID=UPI00138F43E3|nr:DUF1971 domain-containing protein [Rhizobium sp. Root1204]